MTLLNAATVPRAEKVLRKATCLAGDVLGDCMRVSGPVSGGLYVVAKMDPAVDTSDQAVAIIVSKLTATECYIQLQGPVSGVYSGLTPGGLLYVGSDSQLTHTPPVIPDVIQVMGTAVDATELMLAPHSPEKDADFTRILTTVDGNVMVDSLTGNVMVSV